MVSTVTRLDLLADDIRMVHHYMADGDYSGARRATELAMRELAYINGELEDMATRHTATD